MRQWLDQAQGQLQNTQTALTVKEQECRELQDQLQAQLSSSAVLQVKRGSVGFSGGRHRIPMHGYISELALHHP